MADPAPVTCALCGRLEETPPLTWTMQTAPRGVEWVCESCARSNLRSIEAKLDTEYW